MLMYYTLTPYFAMVIARVNLLNFQDKKCYPIGQKFSENFYPRTIFSRTKIPVTVPRNDPISPHLGGNTGYTSFQRKGQK